MSKAERLALAVGLQDQLNEIASKIGDFTDSTRGDELAEIVGVDRVSELHGQLEEARDGLHQIYPVLAEIIQTLDKKPARNA